MTAQHWRMTSYAILAVLTVLGGACCAGVLHPRLPPVTLRRMIAFLAALHDGANVQRSFGTAGGPWEFNLRDLLRWCQLAEAAVSAAPSNTPEGETEVCNHDWNLVLGPGLLLPSANRKAIGVSRLNVSALLCPAFVTRICCLYRL